IAAENEVRRAGFTRIAHATPGMQYVRPTPGTIHRGPWHSTLSLARNVAELCVDGRLFVRVSGRSPVGCRACEPVVTETEPSDAPEALRFFERGIGLAPDSDSPPLLGWDL